MNTNENFKLRRNPLDTLVIKGKNRHTVNSLDIFYGNQSVQGNHLNAKEYCPKKKSNLVMENCMVSMATHYAILENSCVL